MKYIKLFEQWLLEQNVKDNGWKKLATFMIKFPHVFPKVDKKPDGSYDVEDCTAIQFSKEAQQALKGAGDEFSEDGVFPTEKYLDKDILDLIHAVMDDVVYTQDDIIRNEARALGIENSISSDSIVRDSSGVPKFLPFGAQFNKKNWRAKSNMLPTIGNGKDQTAARAKNGWILKRFKKPIDEKISIEAFEHMSKHSDVFANVKNYSKGTYWQEDIDERGWHKFKEDNPEEAESLYAELEQAYYNYADEIPYADHGDFSEEHNIGFDKDGKLKIYDF